VRRLLDAGLDVMRQGGTGLEPAGADIVAGAGLSNARFYRHFRVEGGAGCREHRRRVVAAASYLAHSMEKAPTAEAKVRAWVDGVMPGGRCGMSRPPRSA